MHVFPLCGPRERVNGRKLFDAILIAVVFCVLNSYFFFWKINVFLLLQVITCTSRRHGHVEMEIMLGSILQFSSPLHLTATCDSFTT